MGISEQALWAYDAHPRQCGDWLRFKCCIHGGKNQNLSFKPDSGYYRCFKCLESGFVNEKQRHRRDSSVSKTKQYRPHVSAKPIIDIETLKERDRRLRPWLKKLQDNLQPGTPHADYLLKRGIPIESAKLWGLGASNKNGVNVPWPHFTRQSKQLTRQGDGRIVVPTFHYWEGDPLLINLYGRSLSDEPKNQRHDFLVGPKGVIGCDPRKLDHVFICEGAFDCLSLLISGYPAVAFSGLSVDWSSLPNRVIFAYDNDDGIGDKATREQGLEGMLRGHQVEYADPRCLAGFKDWNQMLQTKGSIYLNL